MLTMGGVIIIMGLHPLMIIHQNEQFFLMGF